MQATMLSHVVCVFFLRRRLFLATICIHLYQKKARGRYTFFLYVFVYDNEHLTN